ncbi:MAG: DUF896 domain-containing protein [Clostridia bacterium]|jgi:Uncharacterized protein conserved in bacteria|nr:DUF896 domain-containing protein [Clostridia bacterium]MBR5380346.1 DUF896 domain-containing protein [Clostridia bacterium]MBR5752803.1 DUF896 domain-containing protein [Clostridia bacterium]
MDRQNIERLSELTRIAKTRPLTQEEAGERHERRQRYLEAFRKNFRQQLDHTVIQYEDGTKQPLKRVEKNK